MRLSRLAIQQHRGPRRTELPTTDSRELTRCDETSHSGMQHTRLRVQHIWRHAARNAGWALLRSFDAREYLIPSRLRDNNRELEAEPERVKEEVEGTNTSSRNAK